MQSEREDGRGHWPAGCRRNENTGKWAGTCYRVRRFIRANHQRGVVSIRALAADLGVSDRTVRRWLRGEDRPPPAMQRAVDGWMVQQRRRVEI